MTRRLIAFLAFILSLVTSTAASGQVTVIFYARDEMIGHAFVRFTGTMTGPNGPIQIDEAWGFYPMEPVWPLSYQWASLREDSAELAKSTAFLRVTIPEERYNAIKQGFSNWLPQTGGGYNLMVQNCVHFARSVALQAGLNVQTLGNTPMLPQAFVHQLVLLNPQVAGLPGHVPGTVPPDLLESALNNWAHIASGRGGLSGQQLRYTSAIAKRHSEMEAARQTLVREQQTAANNLRIDSLTRAAAEIRARSARQANINDAEFAQLQEEIRRFEDGIRNGTTTVQVPIGGTGSSNQGSSGSDADGTIVAPLPDPCDFFPCERRPQQHGPQFSIPSPQPALSEEFRLRLAGTSAPQAGRNVVHVGNVLPGQTVNVEVEVENLAAEPRRVAVFTEGQVALQVGTGQSSVPLNVYDFSGGQVRTIRLRLQIPSARNGRVSPVETAPQLIVMQDGAIVQELFFAYNLYLREEVDIVISSGAVATGSGEDWSPDYELCSGTDMFGYRLAEVVSFGLRTLDDQHYRDCSSWGRCSGTYPHARYGTCFSFAAQGHEKRNRPFDSDVGRYGFSVEGTLSARYRLQRPASRWLTAADVRR